MQPSTPTLPVSGTFYEAVQLLRPHPKIRPVSAPCIQTNSRHTTPEGDQWSKTSETTAVERPDTSHLYKSGKKHEVATGQELGSLGRLSTDILAGSRDPTSPTSSPLSPRSMIIRAKTLLSPRPSFVPSTPQGEKLHRAFCKTRSIVQKNLRRSKRPGVAQAGSRASLRSKFYSASAERLILTNDRESTEEWETSTISDDPPQIALLRPVSKFLPRLANSIPDNKIGGSIIAEQCSSNELGEDMGECIESTSPHAASLHWPSSSVASSSKDNSIALKTSFQDTPSAKEDNDVLLNSNETSQINRPVTNLMVELRDATESTRGFKVPSNASTGGSPMITPPPSTKLRHTALQLNPRLESKSLRSQYSASEPASNSLVFNVPKMWRLEETEINKTVRLAPSLEEGLSAEDWEVYEENAIATAAPIVRGVEPDVVDIRHSQVVETLGRQSLTVSSREPPDNDPNDQWTLSGPSYYSSTIVMPATSHVGLPPTTSATPPSTAPKCGSAGCPNSEASVLSPTIPFQVLDTIVVSAAYGDAECRALAWDLYKEVIEAGASDSASRWGSREQRLLRQSHLIQELDSLAQFGLLRQDIFEMIRGQLFPIGITEMLDNQDFTAYIYRAVSSFTLAEERAKEILELAIGDEDERFRQCSPEEEVFFEREPINPGGFVYGDSTNDGHYGRLGPMPSTVGTYESARPQQKSGWRSSNFLSKVVHMFRIGIRKRTV